MDPQLLIQDIVRQTTVLIAQISTAAGLRAPLAHVANQVFLDLARELEAQGVRRNVVADMFGLALRSYQLKFQRALDTATVQRSLWRDVFDVLAEGGVSRANLEERFARVEPKALSAVVNDLVDSGLAYRSGRGQTAIYGLVPEQDTTRLLSEGDELSLAHHVWLHLSTHGARTPLELAGDLGVPEEVIERASAHLLRQGTVGKVGTKLEALSFDIPVGSSHGWEAAVCDHFRAVSSAIANKLESPASRASDQIGGTTLTFTVHDDHPQKGEVLGLLARFRRELDQLWEATSAHNKLCPPPEQAHRVTFYFGQNITTEHTEISSHVQETDR